MTNDSGNLKKHIKRKHGHSQNTLINVSHHAGNGYFEGDLVLDTRRNQTVQEEDEDNSENIIKENENFLNSSLQQEQNRVGSGAGIPNSDTQRGGFGKIHTKESKIFRRKSENHGEISSPLQSEIPTTHKYTIIRPDSTQTVADCQIKNYTALASSPRGISTSQIEISAPHIVEADSSGGTWLLDLSDIMPVSDENDEKSNTSSADILMDEMSVTNQTPRHIVSPSQCSPVSIFTLLKEFPESSFHVQRKKKPESDQQLTKQRKQEKKKKQTIVQKKEQTILQKKECKLKRRHIKEEPIKNKFRHTIHKHDLQAEIKPEPCVIEKILRKRGIGRNREYLIKYSGYPDTFNSWVPYSKVLVR